MKLCSPVLTVSADLCCRVLDCPRCDICPCSRCITLFKWNLLTPRIETVSTVFPPGVYILLCRGAFQLEMVNIHPCILHPPLSILYSFSVWSIGQILLKYQSNEIPLSLKICIFLWLISMLNMIYFWDYVSARERKKVSLQECAN